MTYHTTRKARPDTLTQGDYIYNPTSARWEPVKNAYWSEAAQRFVVYSGPLGHVMHIYGPGEKVYARRYY